MADFERPSEALIFPNLLRQRATETPDVLYVQEVGGASLTYAQTYERARRWAVGLQAIGVREGSTVVTMLPNSCESVVAWSAASLLGAINVPLNNAYLGPVLEHAVKVATPAVMIVDAQFARRFADIQPDLPRRPTLIVRGPGDGDESKADPGGWFDIGLMGELEADVSQDSLPAVRPGWADIGTLLFTSGTTGNSKAVAMPWLHLYRSSTRIWPADHMSAADRMYSPWPFNHISGTGAAYLMAVLGGAVVMRERWSTTSFMTDIENYGCTTTTLMGEMVGYVDRMQPPNDPDSFPLDKVFCSPTPAFVGDLMDRLGARFFTNFNSTEMSSPIGSVGLEPVPWNSCGKRRNGVEIRLVDVEGEEVEDGQAGEVLVRTVDPAAMNAGYWGMPEASAEAWRGGWFHTGDLLRRDQDGFYYFLGRLNDRIRSRGENVNSEELEAIVNNHPLVRQSAAVGIPLPDGEDDIVLFVVPLHGGLGAEEIHAHCETTLPKFMRPSRVMLVPDLPETPTGKIQKQVLRTRLAQQQDVRPRMG